MIQRLVHFFLDRHLLTNGVFLLIFIAGIFGYQTIKKEEFPDITFRTMAIQTVYPNATAEDVESDVTIPIEERIQNISGIQKINSSSALGLSSITVELDRNADVQTVKTDLSNAIQSVPLPDDVLNDPTIRHFDISRKAILDIGLYIKDTPNLSRPERFELQRISRQLNAFLTSNRAFSETRFTGYLSEQMHIDVNPKRLDRFKIPIHSVQTTLQEAHRQMPVGETYTDRWTPVRIKQSIEPITQLNSIKLNRSFGQGDVYLRDVAESSPQFERKNSITRINGSEAVILELIKSSDTDILTAIDIAKHELKRFESIYLQNSPIQIILLDDESITLRNRLNIISTNGLIGFGLILIALVIFLNPQSAFWVAIGLPFCVAFTLVSAQLLGLTINGITLSAIIIVLGIVVDDAIIIAEHIYRCHFNGLSMKKAAIKGVQEMLTPVLAGVTTTCMAFVPLLMFDSRFGDFVKPIPIVLFLMLGASLLESFFILPGHLVLSPPRKRQSKPWFLRLEKYYLRLIQRLIKRRWLVLSAIFLLMLVTLFVGKSQIKYVMFPHDESREIVISGKVNDSTSLTETASALAFMDESIPRILGDNNLGFTTKIARQRFGGKQSVNSFFVTIEIPEANDRDISANEIIEKLKAVLSGNEAYSDLTFRKARWGQQSGSAIEVKVQSNSDSDRLTALERLENKIKAIPEIESVEIKKAFIQPVIEIELKQNELQRLGVSTSTIAAALKSAMGGIQLFDIQRPVDPIEYKLRLNNVQQRPISAILNLKIANSQGYLVPLSEMVALIRTNKPNEINRRDGYRISTLYADLKSISTVTPLELAQTIESELFPEIIKQIPGVILSFDGEVIDSREGKKEFLFSFAIAILGIYLILTLMFQSLVKPFRILFILPFGIVSVIFIFLLIGKSTIGFFGLIGVLGMLGVVINDAIVLYVRFDRYNTSTTLSSIAKVSKTRLRAILLTTITTVAGVMPTAYGIGGYDAMLSEMMLSLGWGLVGGMLVTLILVPIAYACEHDVSRFIKTINLKRFIPGLGLLLFFTLPIYAEELPDTLFIQKALKNNPDYQFILEQQIGELHQIDLSVAVSDIVTSVLLGASYNFDNEETIPDSSLKISKLFYPTGTNVNAFYQNRRFAGSNFKVESYGAAFSQDLLQNAFGRNNRLTLQNTSLQKKIIQIQTLESIEDYIAKLHQIYNDWTESFKRVQLERNILNNIELLRKEVQLKYKRRIASKNDVDRVRLQELNQRGILIDTEKQLKHDADHIGQLMNDFNTYTPIVKPIIRFSLAIPSENRSLQALSLMEEANEIETKIRANELFPSITLDTSIFNEARTVNNVRTDNLFLTGGLGIDLPVSNQSKQLSYQLSKSIQRQSQLTLAASKLAYQNDSNRLADEILVLERRFQIDEKKARLANDILRQDGDDYRRGSISLNEYIESLNRSIQSQHAILSRSIQYQRARIEWYRLTDRLITPTP